MQVILERDDHLNLWAGRIEMDDAYLGGEWAGKRRRWAEEPKRGS